MGIPRPHVPYRNSLMTMVLRDSLGGNCKTTMVANVNLSTSFLDESISTCRFAQRVAMVSNNISVNEETDPALVIQRLKQEVRELKLELQLLQGGEELRGPLTPGELDRLRSDVDAYIRNGSPSATLDVGASMLSIHAVFAMLKEYCRVGGTADPVGVCVGASGDAAGCNRGEVPQVAGVVRLQEDVKKLRLQVQQRDNEINILVAMLKKRGGAVAATGPVAAVPPPGALLALSASSEQRTAATEQGQGCMTVPPEHPDVAQAQQELLDVSILKDRSQAFELFRKSYRRNAAIEDNKAVRRPLVSHYMSIPPEVWEWNQVSLWHDVAQAICPVASPLLCRPKGSNPQQWKVTTGCSHALSCQRCSRKST
jgi:kinesin family member 6/9